MNPWCNSFRVRGISTDLSLSYFTDVTLALWQDLFGAFGELRTALNVKYTVKSCCRYTLGNIKNNGFPVACPAPIGACSKAIIATADVCSFRKIVFFSM